MGFQCLSQSGSFRGSACGFNEKCRGKLPRGCSAALGALKLAQRIAAAIHKLHQANVATERRHAMATNCASSTSAWRKSWHSDPVGQSASSASWPPVTAWAQASLNRARADSPRFLSGPGRHPGTRICLIDFDLYCLGRSRLGHWQFHRPHDGTKLARIGRCSRIGQPGNRTGGEVRRTCWPQCRAAITAYTTLTIARHIYLSTQFLSRQPFTPALLELCEQRLGLA